jgi:hypothetical protein
VGVLAERDVRGTVAEQPCKPGSHAGGLDLRFLPFLVDIFSGIEPGALLGFESDVRPCLMRVAGQQQPLADTEARIVMRQRWDDVRDDQKLRSRKRRAMSAGLSRRASAA